MNKHLMVGIIVGQLVLGNMYACEIRDELKHTKELIHLQNSIINDIYIEVQNKDRKWK